MTAKSHAAKTISREVPHGTAEHVIGKPHGEPDAPHGAGRRGDMAEENKPVEGEGTEPHGEENEPDYKALYEAEKGLITSQIDTAPKQRHGAHRRPHV